MFLTIIIFIIILGLLIFVHELGHFLLAKRSGVKVEEFGFGFPPRLWSVKKGETRYSLNVIPLGGFIKILGEEGEEKDNPRSFASQKAGGRLAILAAGVAMNFLLAMFLLSLGYFIGLPQAVEDNEKVVSAKVQISLVAPASPARQAGLQIGDEILSLRRGQEEVRNIFLTSQVQDFVSRNQGEKIVLEIRRGAQILIREIVPRPAPPPEEGPLGIGLVRTALVAYPWYAALWQGTLSTFQLTWLTAVSLVFLVRDLFVAGRFAGEVYGPVGIFSLTSQATQMGFIYLLQLAALLSLNLGIINALPFPALDGSRILFLLIEKIKGSPVSRRIEKAVHSAGFAFLILLMIAVTFKDVARLF